MHRNTTGFHHSNQNNAAHRMHGNFGHHLHGNTRMRNHNNHQHCPKCKGKGFCHDSTMSHKGLESTRCFFCSDCTTCQSRGIIDGPMYGHFASGPTTCYKCKGDGFYHDSGMTHDKPPTQKCFFCTDCRSCNGTGVNR